MEARITAQAAPAATGPARSLRFLLLLVLLACSMGASVRTRNFVVQTDDPAMAREFAETAERCRRELAISWLGKAMPDWAAPCVMSVRVGAHLGAGGSTSFVFDRGEVFGWRMSIQGSHERVIDSVLPHEITHMILASHFRRPLPRWADEGAATSTECESERKKHHRMLTEFLTTGRGIPFNRMFAMTEYPRDVMPLYAQGFSVVDYLVELGGRRKFIEFLGEAMETERWGDTANRYYGIASLGEMQNRWLAWVREGSPRLDMTREVSPEIMLAGASSRPPTKSAGSPAPSRSVRPAATTVAAAAGRRTWPEPNLIHRIPRNSAALVDAAAQCDCCAGVVNRESAECEPAAMVPVVFEKSPGTIPAEAWQPPPSAIASATSPLHSEMARPQPVEQARQIILEWNKPGMRFDAPPAPGQGYQR